MVGPKVFFSDRNAEPHYNMLDKIEHIIENLEIQFEPNEKVMIKTHFGAWGNTNYLRPAYTRKIVDIILSAGALPFVSDTVSIGYGESRPYGGRTDAAAYLRKAAMNGFSHGTMGAPIVMADGYFGVDTFEVKIDGSHLKSVPVASALLDCDKVIVLTHAKFHHVGLASAMKNIGVGLVGKSGKAAIHSPGGLVYESDKCLGPDCSKCLSYCPSRCISMGDVVEIDWDKCIHCLICSSICSSKAKADALKGQWIGKDIQLRIAESALGVSKSIGSEKFYYLNMAIDITHNCDCISVGSPLLMHDIGIFGSSDILAIDQATYDEMKAATLNPDSPAIDRMSEFYEKSESMLAHAQDIRLGSKDYELEILSKSKDG